MIQAQLTKIIAGIILPGLLFINASGLAAFRRVDSADDELKKELTGFLDHAASTDSFSGAVLVAKGGQPIFRRAYGLANQNDKTANNVETKFNIGSMSKMFTAVSIAQLAERGKLAFEDPIGKHLPNYPNADVARKVTIHHLLTHTSGMADYLNDRYFAQLDKMKTVNDLLPLFVDQPLSIGYTRMNPSGQPDPTAPRHDNISSRPAKGSPAGGAYSTVDDLLKFVVALQAKKLLTGKFTDIVTTGKIEAGGIVGKYAYGFGDKIFNGRHIVGHNGGAPGVGANLDMFPEPGYAAIILTNYDPPAMMAVIMKIRTLVPASVSGLRNREMDQLNQTN